MSGLLGPSPSTSLTVVVYPTKEDPCSMMIRTNLFMYVRKDYPIKKKRMPIFGILMGSLYLVVMAGVFYCEEEEEEEE